MQVSKKELELSRKIIEATENKKDTSALLKELAELKAKEASEAKLKELQQIADQRTALKDKARKIVNKTAKQSKAINKFLKKRDSLIDQLKPLIEPLKELAKLQAAAWERLPGECYLFNDIGAFKAAVKDIPGDYLPEGFGCDFLTMQGGLVGAEGKANEALQYFLAAYGILSAFEKHKSKLPLPEAEGLMSIEKKEKGSKK